MKDLALGAFVALCMTASAAIGYWVASTQFPPAKAMITIEDEDGEPYEPPEKLVPLDYHHCDLGDLALAGHRYMQWKWFLDNRSPKCTKLEHKHTERRVTPKPEIQTWEL